MGDAKPDDTTGRPPLLRTLILEDNPRDAKLAVALLEGGGYKVQSTVLDLPESFREHLETAEYDVILADFNLLNWTAYDALAILKRSGKDVPLIVVTGALGDEAAVECIKQGAADFVLKDRLARLPSAVQRVLEEKRLRAENKRTFEATSRLATIVESSDDAIIAGTLECVITSWNKGAEKLYGYSAGEVLGQPISVLVPPERVEEVTQNLARLKRGERLEHFESVRVRKDGSLVDVSLSIFPLTDSRGEVTGIASIARDITERKRAEEALGESEARYRSLVEAAPDVIYTVSAEDGSLRSLNPAFETVTGWSRAEWLGKPFAGIVHPDDLPVAVEALQRASRGETQHRFELRVLSKSGEYLVGEFTSTPHVKDGKVAGALGIGRDITERKRAEEALRQSEAKLKEALLAAQMGVWEWTAATGTVTWDENLYRIAGRDPKLPAPSYEEFPQIFAPESWESHKAAAENALATGTPYELDLEMVRPDGSRRWVIGRGEPLRDASGNITRLHGTVQDITERKAAERAALEAESKYREIFEGAMEGIYRTSLEGRSLAANPALAKILGFDSAPEVLCAITDTAHQVWLDPDERLHFTALLQERGAVPGYECQWKRKDGTVIWASLNSRIVRGVDGRALYYEGFVEDITERKRAEAALIEERHLLYTLMDNLPDKIYFKDRESRFTRMNKMHTKLFGLSDPAQVVGKTDFDFFTPEHAQAAYNDEQGIIRTGQPVVGKEEMETWPDGHVTWVSTTKMPLRDAGGNIIGTFGVSRDITERKRAEEALRETNEYLESLFNYANAPIIVWDPQFRITRFNHAFESLTGRSAKDVIGEPLEILFPATMVESSMELIRKTLGGERWEIVEISILRLDGSVRTVLWNSATIYTPDGKAPVATVAQGQDITERKRAEAELADRLRFETLLAELSARFVHVPAEQIDAEIKDAQRRVCESLGLDSCTLWQAMPETPSFIPLTHIYRQPGRPPIPEGINSGQHLPWSTQQLRAGKVIVASSLEELPAEAARDRQTFAFFGIKSVLALGLSVGGGPVIAGLAFSAWTARTWPEEVVKRLHVVAQLFWSALERQRSERALRESEERFRSLFENATVGIYRTTPEGRILVANPALVKMLGYANLEELAARNLEEEFEPAYPRRTFRELIERDGEVKGLESAWAKRDWSTIFVRESARAVRDESGNVLYYDGIVEDITERKQLERQLIQAQKMEAVGQLAGGVAHDFNNLLTIINGYATLLAQRTPSEDPRRAWLKEILMAGGRAASLTRQLLAFSRQQVLEPVVLDLNSVIANTEKMLRRLIGEDVEMVTTLKLDLGRVKVDPGQIEQVIMNLAVNARDAMPEGGKLLIETSNVEIDEDYARSHSPMMPGKYVMVVVSDTGCGMDQETQARIFEPFFTTKEKGRGTGLGLATVYGIVKQSGGFIWVSSEPGQGSTFKVYFPRVEEVVPAAEPSRIRPKLARGSETVLVVEDEEGVRSLVRETLASQGYKVLEAAGAAQALEIAEQHTEPIHLLLTDVVMPQTGGKELFKRLSPLHPETKVLYMSGYTDDAVVRQGILEAGTFFLQKPFPPNALLLKIREVLKKKPGARK
jgi:PAS domain S-box-containing protein